MSWLAITLRRLVQWAANALLACVCISTWGCRCTGEASARGPQLSPARVAAAGGAAPLAPALRVEAGRGGEPASICPADAWLFLRIDHLKGWQQSGNHDALVTYGRMLFTPLCPPAVWARAKQQSGTDGWALFSMYLGERVAFMDLGTRSQPKLVLMSRALPEALARMPTLFGLAPVAELAPVGAYRFFAAADPSRQVTVAIGSDYFLVSESRHATVMRDMLVKRTRSDREPGLGESSAFRTLSARLPGPGDAMVFFREASGSGRHAAVLTRRGQGLKVEYAALGLPGERPGSSLPVEPTDAAGERCVRDAEFPHLDRSRGVDFGPLPAGITGVAALNLVHRQPKDLGILDLPVIFGSVRKRIIPGVDPPLLAFLHSVSVERAGKEPVQAPVAGVAVRLRDPSVSGDLDGLIRTMHVLATMGSLRFDKSLFGVRTVRLDGYSFKVADFANTLVPWIKEPAVAALANLPDPAGLRRIAYGAVGDWYIVCSQEAFLRQCVETYVARQASRELGAVPAAQGLDLSLPAHLLFTAVVRGPQLSELAGIVSRQLEEERGKDSATAVAHGGSERPYRRLERVLHETSSVFRAVSRHWRKIHTVPSEEPVPKENSAITERNEPASTEHVDVEGALRPIRWIDEVLKHRHSFSLQIWRGEDWCPRGRLRVLSLASVDAEPAGASAAATPAPRVEHGR